MCVRKMLWVYGGPRTLTNENENCLSTAPWVPESSLTPVLTRPADACLHKSDGMWNFHRSMAVPNKPPSALKTWARMGARTEAVAARRRKQDEVQRKEAAERKLESSVREKAEA